MIQFLHKLTCVHRPHIDNPFVDLAILASYSYPTPIRRNRQLRTGTHRPATQFAISTGHRIIEADLVSRIHKSHGLNSWSNGIGGSAVGTVARYNRGNNA